MGLAAVSTQAQEPVVTLRATVTGNQEQPKVMYLVPWQQRESTDFEYAPHSALVQDLFMQIDRAEFVRELNYRALLESTAAQASDSN
jgi:hypothetical protein